MTNNDVKMNHTNIDWEYLTEILTLMESRQPRFPIEEWAEHPDARFYFIRKQAVDKVLGLHVDNPYPDPTEQERLELGSAYDRLHTHTNFLLDLEFIEKLDRSERSRNHPGRNSPWLRGYEVWPTRITAKGYLFLEAVRGPDQANGRVLQTLQNASTAVAKQAVKHGITEIMKAIVSAVG